VSLTEATLDALSALPDWLIVIIISMLPFIELRLALPIAILGFNMNPIFAFFLCISANMLPVPFILMLLGAGERWIRKYDFWSRFLDRIFERTRRRASDKIEKYETLGLMLFVGIPLPVTGAWTGALIAYLFDLDKTKSFMAIFGGVLIAGIIILIVSVGLQSIF
jgi:uncharacterized membrane protein